MWKNEHVFSGDIFLNRVSGFDQKELFVLLKIFNDGLEHFLKIFIVNNKTTAANIKKEIEWFLYKNFNIDRFHKILS